MFARFFARPTPYPFIPFEHFDDATGGPGTFMRNLKKGLDAAGFRYLEKDRDYRRASAIFFPIAYDPKVLAWFKKKSLPIVQRLDGLYYPEQHGPEYKNKNRKIENCYRNFADHIVFQSKFSRLVCREYLGPPGAGAEEIIYNGADGDLFYPDPVKTGLGSVPVFITTGSIRHEEQLQPILAALDALPGKFRLVVAGEVEESLRPLLRKPYVEHQGPVPLERIGALLRAADIFIYSILNPSCPNSVIEAIRCGLPVVSFDSGAVSELCAFNPSLLAPVAGGLVHTRENFDAGTLREKIRLCLDGFAEHKKTALENAPRYALQDMVRQYAEVLVKVCGK